jgi:MarR family 2-MHQ and catechol resistance regulon transcriptional repressor
VERQPNPNDRRASNVVLIEEGRALFDEIFPKNVATISQNLSFISNDEKEQLILGTTDGTEPGNCSLERKT